ncbi:LamB/YcsF family protein [Martelella alba]|uniref:5-oxoprolinase subunit A n=1 Tax=Martelella alba TaxID=2590451 RepID=A0A506UGC6_9HYPH|nr:5-oxoprolinase subunit PxpA [Martelella alba]TPW32294.1 LamB/YcsF family protein [Martelella alba]
MRQRIDINSDMGESFGAWDKGDDAAMLKIVSSANIACGFHAGDPNIMAQTFAIARDRNVAVGAHPGFPDLMGFGRRHIPYSIGEIERMVAYQIGAAQAMSDYVGHPITHVKAHGALGNLAQQDKAVARALNNAIKAVDPALICLAIALGHQARIGEEMGLTVVPEIFADRAYSDDGFLVPRGQKGALIHDPEEAGDRVVAMVSDGAIITVSGKRIETPMGSVCVHSDTPEALLIAQTVRNKLEKNGFAVANFIH